MLLCLYEMMYFIKPFLKLSFRYKQIMGAGASVEKKMKIPKGYKVYTLIY